MKPEMLQNMVDAKTEEMDDTLLLIEATGGVERNPDGTIRHVADVDSTIEAIYQFREEAAQRDELLGLLEEIRDYRGGADNALEDKYVMARVDAAIASAKEARDE